ncbi:hypothetical protein CYY_007715 [Polysphondylium violaceum]|uniref:Uncharacterized protein n=1 Tax=Polysphondylium violaceum TaxID=133409 RepID=A0A8J4UXI2_9MYCE|nr:hypothetical protein CYY_007715 [Polysphondylium violaceum]
MKLNLLLLLLIQLSFISGLIKLKSISIGCLNHGLIPSHRDHQSLVGFCLLIEIGSPNVKLIKVFNNEGYFNETIPLNGKTIIKNQTMDYGKTLNEEWEPDIFLNMETFISKTACELPTTGFSDTPKPVSSSSNGIEPYHPLFLILVPNLSYYYSDSQNYFRFDYQSTISKTLAFRFHFSLLESRQGFYLKFGSPDAKSISFVDNDHQAPPVVNTSFGEFICLTNSLKTRIILVPQEIHYEGQKKPVLHFNLEARLKSLACDSESTPTPTPTETQVLTPTPTPTETQTLTPTPTPTNSNIPTSDNIN